MAFMNNGNMKLKTVYACQKCGFQSGKWMGRCSGCDEWNTMIEDVINVGKEETNQLRARAPRQNPSTLPSQPVSAARLLTGIGEWDQVLGEGFVEGSLVLLSGEPGIGKSTLTLQVVGKIAGQREKVLYVTGEESVEQVSDRATRLGIRDQNLQILYENNLENIIATVEAEKPNFLVIDSVQVMSSSEVLGVAGSLSQVRLVTERILNTIKTHRIPTLLIGHVNKEGNIAGPKALEHLVDTVLLLEGERDHELRMLRALKNRFGTVSQVGLFEMNQDGLSELKNPGQWILENRPENAAGSCLTMSMEGNRPLLLEVQALVNHTTFGYPKRMASGFDRNRLELLIAVLQKHAGLNLQDQDVYINITGGLTLSDPAADFAVCMAILSSFRKKALPRKLVAWGEVGLTGEVRKGYHDLERRKAVEKLGLSATDGQTKINMIEKDFTK